MLPSFVRVGNLRDGKSMFRMFETRVLREYLDLEERKVTGCRKLHNDEICIIQKILLGNKIEENEIGRDMVRMVEMQTNILVRKSERKTPVGIP
jgi:hypothetical protein